MGFALELVMFDIQIPLIIVIFTLLVFVILFTVLPHKLRKTLKNKTEEARKSNNRIDHINRILSAIRNVNRLIVKEKSQGKLLNEVCELLVETRGFYHAWIILTRKNVPVEPYYHKGFNGKFTPMTEFLREGSVPECGMKALSTDEVQIVKDPGDDCRNCSLSCIATKRSVFTVRLRYEEYVFGFFSVSIPRENASSEEEQGLFSELADDISFALWTIAEKADNRILEKQYSDVLETISDAILVFSPEEIITRFNPGAEVLLNCKAVEAIGKDIYAFLPENRIEEWDGIKNEVMQEGNSKGRETEVRACDGRHIPVEITISLHRSEEGNPISITAALRDITERKLSERAIEKRINTLTKPLNDPETLNFEDIFNLEDIQLLQDKLAMATGVASIIARPDGTPITKPSNFSRLCNEIIRKTEKGRINCFKSDSELGKAIYKGPRIQQCLSGGLWDAGARITVENKHIANWLIGQVRDETQNEEQILEYAREIGADPEDAVDAFYEMPAMSLDEFNNIAEFLYSLANQLSVAAYQNVQQARFIEQRRKADQEREQLMSAIEQSRDTIIITDTEGIIQYTNPALKKTTGYSRNEVIEKHINFLGSEEHEKSFHDNLWNVISTNETWTGRMINKKKNGSLFTEDVSISPVINSDGITTNYVAVKRDVTETLRFEKERSELEEQYQQAQKVESIGRLAGGVAHDLNNLLSPILGYSELLIESRDQKDSDRQKLEQIYQAGLRARDLVRQLLAFSRKQALEYKPINLNQAISNFQKLLRRTIREDIRIDIIQSPLIPPTLADIGQIEQVIMNLAVNAQDAMPGGGNLTIETKFTNLDDDYTQAHVGVVPGDYIMLAVSDTGCGMDDETQLKIFEPFFSTKGEQGTGLGLATVYGIVKQHGGNIWVYSEEGRGTTFKIYLPISEIIHSEQALASTPDRGIKGSETILLVEDNEQVRELTEIILIQAGYNVLTVENGANALEVLADKQKPIDLLLTDVIMPEMNGKILYTEAEKIHPKLKVLFMSGYTDNAIAHHGVIESGEEFIQKPFSVKDMTKKIREILDKV